MRRALTVLAPTVLALVVTLGGLGVTSPAAAAAPDPSTFVANPNGWMRTVTGDLTGDGVTDRSDLGEFRDATGNPTACGVQILPGRSRSVLTVVLPVPIAPGARLFCPDLGTVTAAPGGNRLAVSYFLDPSQGSPSVQIYRFQSGRMVYGTGFAGMFHPAVIGSQDFDGDGWGDLWQRTGEGSGFSSYLVRGERVSTLFESSSATWPTVQFFDLNHNAGTDILLSVFDTRDHPAQAIVVDGHTGTSQVLVGDGSAYYSYDLSVVDLDHNALPDLRVGWTDQDGRPVVRYFVNRSFAGRWSFVDAEVD